MSKAQAAARPESLRPLVGAVILLFIVLLALAGLKGHRDLTLARARERDLTTGIDDTQANIDRLRGKIERLKSDPATLERMAREQLGMVRSGDVVIELPANGELVPLPKLAPLVVPSPAPAAPPPLAAAVPKAATPAPMGPPAPQVQRTVGPPAPPPAGPPLSVVGPPPPPGFGLPSPHRR